MKFNFVYPALVSMVGLWLLTGCASGYQPREGKPTASLAFVAVAPESAKANLLALFSARSEKCPDADFEPVTRGFEPFSAANVFRTNLVAYKPALIEAESDFLFSINQTIFIDGQGRTCRFAGRFEPIPGGKYTLRSNLVSAGCNLSLEVIDGNQFRSVPIQFVKPDISKAEICSVFKN